MVDPEIIPPTYSTEEALRLIPDLDRGGLVLLGDIITEEKARYPVEQLRVILSLWDVFYFVTCHR